MKGFSSWFRDVYRGWARAKSDLLLQKRSLLTDSSIAVAVALGNLAILGPYVHLGFNDRPWGNSYFYMMYARLFRDVQGSWNPLVYGGAPLRYLYPPLFQFLLSHWPAASLGHAYHQFAAAVYVSIPVAIYVLGRALFRARIPAALAAILYSLYPSPANYFLDSWRVLAKAYGNAPYGFVALIGYEESAHALAFFFALLAVAAAWRGRWTLAGVMTACVCLTSWPGMFGLGIVLAALAVAKTRDRGYVQAGLAVFGLGVGYGLAAFSLTPGYMSAVTLGNRVIFRHMIPPASWNRTVWMILITAAIMLGAAFWRRIAAEPAFLLAWLAIAGTLVVSFTLAGNSLVPFAHRYMLEFNASLVMALAGIVWLLRKWRVAMAVAALSILGAGAPAAAGFVRQAWNVQPRNMNRADILGYRVAGWLNQHPGAGRTMASGELESELPIWSDAVQVGGPGQDVSNYLIFAAQRQVAFGCGSDSERIAELWLRALNVRYLVVNGARSREYYHWFSRPEKFAVLPVAWDNGAGDTIYDAPGFDGHSAVVVNLPAMYRLPRLTATSDAAFLAAYAAWAAGTRPASIHWNGPDSAVVDAELAADEAVLVKINDDRGWQASGATTASDPIGFLLIRSRSGQRHFALKFTASWDVWLGRAITLLTVVLLLFGVPKPWIAALAVVPAVAAFGLLASALPPTVKVAEEAFVRLQPPTISPQGIVDSATNRPPPFARDRLISAYGVNFGSSTDTAQVWLNGRSAEIVYRSPNMITFKLPPGADPRTAVSVEVNACRGNAFTVETR